MPVSSIRFGRSSNSTSGMLGLKRRYNITIAKKPPTVQPTSQKSKNPLPPLSLPLNRLEAAATHPNAQPPNQTSKNTATAYRMTPPEPCGTTIFSQPRSDSTIIFDPAGGFIG